MPGGMKTSRSPSLHKRINLVPAVETDAEPARLEDAESLGEGRLEPALPVIVGNLPPLPVAVVDQIRRVCEDKIDALLGQARKDIEAIGADDSIAELLNV